MNNQYKCNFCVKSYKEKFNYDRHISVCKYLSQPPRTRLNDLDVTQDKPPSNVELFQIVKHLSIRLDKLEKENQALRQRQNKKKNVLEWLNTNAEQKPIFTFEKWLVDEIQPHVSSMLETVFAHDLITGVVGLFQNYFATNSESVLPICCFANKGSSFYMYEKSKKDDTHIGWVSIPSNTMDKYIEHICQQFIVTFLKDWCEPNHELITTKEKYKDMYAEYYQKILGGTISKELRYSKIKSSLHTCLKRNISSIVEYECE